MIYHLRLPRRSIKGAVTLAGSKSISNRVLIIRALCGDHFPVEGLANARDTQLLQSLLSSEEEVLDAGAAGTTFRFLTAFMAFRDQTRILTGSARMQQRPIGVLVEALRKLGARIEYLAKPGYPPLRIRPHSGTFSTGPLSIPAGTSSQYISALLMVGPNLPEGLELRLEGGIVSRPYIEMTLRIMAYFGVDHQWEEDVIRVPHQAYRSRPFTVEADWSAASYYYAMAALADEADLKLGGLFADSLQGDAALADMMESFGLQTTFEGGSARLKKVAGPRPESFVYDFLRCPDLAQTLAVVCAGLGVTGYFTGLKTLRIKETDRIAALQAELSKVGVTMEASSPPAGADSQRSWYRVSGQAEWRDVPCFDTYEDHRMAMAFAPLSILGEIAVAEPAVVAKSYPAFWEDLQQLGFELRAAGTEASR